MLISIESGGTTTQLGTKPVFKFQNANTASVSTALDVDTVLNRITLSPVLSIDLPEEQRAIKTINGVAPNDYGEFYIDGSECDSWVAIDDSTMGIVDLCPSCKTCEDIYRLKYELENLKMWINTLKDVNLYITKTPGDDDRDEIAYRQSLLSRYRITSSDDPTCGGKLTVDDGYLHKRGLQLLQQYITTVHMWNYIVSRNNSSTVISTAPEEATGFTVQTKRALTSCHGEQNIKCDIEIQPAGIIPDNGVLNTTMPDNYPISVYVPNASNKVLFEPLLKDDQSKALGTISSCTVSTDASDASHKTATTGVIPVKVAGTYVVSIKFLPFVYYEAWRTVNDVDVPVKIRGGVSQEVPGTTASDGTVVYAFNISGHTNTSIPTPTEEDYLTAKAVPTCSVTWRIAWNVTVTWSTTDGESETPRVETENYMYVTNGIRKYYDDIISGTTVTPPPPEPEPEETTDA